MFGLTFPLLLPSHLYCYPRDRTLVACVCLVTTVKIIFKCYQANKKCISFHTMLGH